MTEDDEFGTPDECQHEDVLELRTINGVTYCHCRDCGAEWSRA